jgi:hypothetical protein
VQLVKETDMDALRNSQTNPSASYKDAPTRTVAVGRVDFAYRQLGPDGGVPVIFKGVLAPVALGLSRGAGDGAAEWAKTAISQLDVPF